ncbi:Retrovirus-related Pol polyprotein from transposon TNT 1-94 [Sesbania bispinosa]|nr:Retrovirus-related Pol polyprotein from transposon TNT 1-94 [Sesbania bispinosa]
MEQQRLWLSEGGHKIRANERKGDPSCDLDQVKINVPFFREKGHWKKDCPKLKKQKQA